MHFLSHKDIFPKKPASTPASLALLVAGSLTMQLSPLRAQDAVSSSSESVAASSESIRDDVPSVFFYRAQYEMSLVKPTKDITPMQMRHIIDGYASVIEGISHVQQGHVSVIAFLESLPQYSNENVTCDYQLVGSAVHLRHYSDLGTLNIQDDTITLNVDGVLTTYSAHLEQFSLHGGVMTLFLRLSNEQSDKQVRVFVYTHPKGIPMYTSDWALLSSGKEGLYIESDARAHADVNALFDLYMDHRFYIALSKEDLRDVAYCLHGISSKVQKGSVDYLKGFLTSFHDAEGIFFSRDAFAISVHMSLSHMTGWNHQQMDISVDSNGQLIVDAEPIDIVQIFPNNIETNVFSMGILYRAQGKQYFGSIRVIAHPKGMEPKEW